MDFSKGIIFILAKDDVLYQVKKGAEFGLECWTDVVKTAIRKALNT